MAKYKVKHHEFAAALMRHVRTDDIIGAKHLLVGIDEQDKKLFVAHDNYSLLCVAAGRGNTVMVEFLVEDGKANVEEGGKYRDDDSRLKAPLLCAARKGELELVKILQGLSADINVISENERTLVNEACFCGQTITAEFLIRQGADIKRPDEFGATCLMNSIHHLQLCQLLIEYGARVNSQDNLGNTALHRAITKGNLKTGQLLLEHGSEQNIKNNLGDDALQFASLHGKDSIVSELVARQEPTSSRLIESQQLLGIYCLLLSNASDVTRALVNWRRSVTLRMANPCADFRENKPLPVRFVTKKVDTVEKLEELCQDEVMMHMFALENLLRIVSLNHKEATDGLVRVSVVFANNGKYRSSFDLLKYAFQLLQASTQTWTDEYIRLMDLLTMTCYDAVYRSQFEIEFHDVFEIFDMLTSMVQTAPKINWRDESFCVELIFSFIQFVVRQDKSPDQLVSFKRVVHRLVRSGMKMENGRSFLHYAVKQCCLYHGYLGITELLLECGADVNAVDLRNNTALHLCIQPYTNLVIQYEREEVIKLLLRNSAHVDMVNDSGDIAAKGLPLKILDHVNLQCLAATVIRDRQIPYEGKIPVQLEPFVRMHGRCTF